MANGEASGKSKKLRRLIKGIRVAMLTTVSGNGLLRSRPMATMGAEREDELWFFTRAGSPKTDEIRDNQRVNLSYADVKGNRFVSVSGTATLSRDPAKVKELWDRSLKAWFPQGKKDPDLVLLRVAVDQAEYWDAPSASLVKVLAAAKAAVTGDPGGAPSSEHRKLELPDEPAAPPPPPAPTTSRGGGAQG